MYNTRRSLTPTFKWCSTDILAREDKRRRMHQRRGTLKKNLSSSQNIPSAGVVVSRRGKKHFVSTVFFSLTAVSYVLDTVRTEALRSRIASLHTALSR